MGVSIKSNKWIHIKLVKNSLLQKWKEAAETARRLVCLWVMNEVIVNYRTTNCIMLNWKMNALAINAASELEMEFLMKLSLIIEFTKYIMLNARICYKCSIRVRILITNVWGVILHKLLMVEYKRLAREYKVLCLDSLVRIYKDKIDWFEVLSQYKSCMLAASISQSWCSRVGFW